MIISGRFCARLVGSLVAMALALALALAACSADEPQADEAATDGSPAQNDGGDTSDESTGGSGDEGAGGEPRLVPPLELPADAPGSDEAAEALIGALERFVTEEQLTSGVPWPDLRNPDPVAAYQSAAAFQQWMGQNNPTPSLVEAYTAPGSPERGWDLELFEGLNRLDLRSGPADPPYSMRVEDLVHPAATGITDALLAQVPEGSAAVVYWDSVGTSDVFTADGEFWSSDAGWTELGPWVAIMAPTEVGWQVWWDELTEPPPPGSRRDSGTPQDDPSRTDL